MKLSGDFGGSYVLKVTQFKQDVTDACD